MMKKVCELLTMNGIILFKNKFYILNIYKNGK